MICARFVLDIPDTSKHHRNIHKILILHIRADDLRGFSDEVLDSWEEEEEGANLFNFR